MTSSRRPKRADPECLCTFTNYPSTEFLRPQSVDFLCFNVYLHQQQPFESYLARLQMLADGKPLLLGECGVDSLREGEVVPGGDAGMADPTAPFAAGWPARWCSPLRTTGGGAGSRLKIGRWG